MPVDGVCRRRGPAASSTRRSALVAALHIAGLATLYDTEYGWFGVALALLTWVLFNALWLAVLRRPAVAAALSLASVAALIVLSQFKYSILQLTLTFLDFLIVDPGHGRVPARRSSRNCAGSC